MMKSEDSINDNFNKKDDSNNQTFGGKFTRKRVLRRKNAIRRIRIYQELENLSPRDDRLQIQVAEETDEKEREKQQQFSPGNSGSLPLMEILLMSNASNYRVYCKVRQAILNHHFSKKFCSINFQQTNPVATNFAATNNQITSSFDHFLDEELKLGQLYSKNIPKVISIGLNVILDIIRDTYEQNPNICIRSLESLCNTLQGLKPESLKYEPSHLIDRYFDLTVQLITSSYASIGRKFNALSIYENYHLRVLELSLYSLITLSVARGDISKILTCIKILLVDCFDSHESNGANGNSFFDVEIPGILVLLKKQVCSFLLGKHNAPEWNMIGFPMNSLCETYSIIYDHNHFGSNNNDIESFSCKQLCPTSLTFDGQHLILYRCNKVYFIGSGYNSTPLGRVINSISLDSFISKQSKLKNENNCCSQGFVGFINGNLFVQPDSKWASNKIFHLDLKSLKPINIISLIDEYSSSSTNENLFVKPTLFTTDGDHLISMTAIQDDYFVVRELKLLKMINNNNVENVAVSSRCDIKNKISYTLSSEFTIRLSSVCLGLCGQSAHGLSIPSHNLFKNHEASSPLPNDGNHIKIIDLQKICDTKNITNVICGKDFALILTDQGKVYYTGNSYSLGIRHLYAHNKWYLLNISRPIKIIQIAVGHEGNHALLLGEDGTVFFVGSAKRGEDGETSLRACRLNKPCRLKKFSKVSNFVSTYLACNYGTSAIVTNEELFLFGKDAHNSNSNGLVTGLPSFFPRVTIKSVALGKAHLLILLSNGLVITSGFSNKGQCGFNPSLQPASDFQAKQAIIESPDDSINQENEIKIHGHTFTYGITRNCTKCSNCTENGNNCQINKSNKKSKLIDSQEFCGCGEGNSGCFYCGICTICSQTYSICLKKHEKLEGSKFHLENSSTVKTTLTSSFLNIDAESDHDCSSKIASISPTVLPLSQINAVLQIAAGLHHSVLLTNHGEVYTFGSNQFGQLGVGDFINRYTPTKIETNLVTNDSIVSVCAGSNHTAFLTSHGDVFTFGSHQQGQLGRSCYNTCKLDFTWNSFPAKMENIGSEYGRVASFVSASGDFTFVKYDEMLLSSSLFFNAKLMADKVNLFLVSPPPILHHIKSFDELFEQKSCRHHFCRTESFSNNNSMVADKMVFNNLDSNVLIISRTNGTCSILNSTKNNFKFLKDFDFKNNVNFDLYSSMCIDKYYNNFWAYNALRDSFSRFDLMSLEVSHKIIHFLKQKKLSDHHFDRKAKFPASLSNLYVLNNFNNSNNSSQLIKHIPSVIQPDISIPFSEFSSLRKTPQQLVVEIFSAITALTHSNFFGFSINDKLDKINYLAHNLLPEEFISMCRFEDYGGGWGYPPHSVEAIKFSSDCDIILGGIGLYGGRGEYSARIRLFDFGFEESELEKEGDLINETDTIHYECLPRQKYQIFFDEPVLIQANRWYVIWASINGPSSDCGSNGQAFVCTSDQIMFHFKSSKLSNNGTDVNSGQIPELIYKPIKSTDYSFHYFHNQQFNNHMNLLSLDEEGLPFTISKDFVFKINSACMYTLGEIIRHSWNVLKKLFNETNLDDLLAHCTFKNNQNEFNLERLDCLISKIKKQLYIACFSFELVRTYVQLFVPNIDQNTHKKSSNNSQFGQIQKFLHYDYDEYKKISNSIYEICLLINSILLNPIDLNGKLKDWLDKNENSRDKQRSTLKLIKLKFIILVTMNNFFIDECYETFLSCCYVFYPTYLIKWSFLCDLLSPMEPKSNERNCDDISLIQTSSNLFSNKQLYLLSAMIQAHQSPSIKLLSFFPFLQGSLHKSYQDFENLAELMNPSLDVIDLSCHVILKRLAEFHNYGDFYIKKKYTCQFIYENFLSILIRPLHLLIYDFKQKRQNLKMNEPFSENRRYQELITENSENNLFNPFELSCSAESNSSTFNDDGNEDEKLEFTQTSEIEYNQQHQPTTDTEACGTMFDSFNHFVFSSCHKTFSNDSMSFEIFLNNGNSTSVLNDKQVYVEKLISATSDFLLKFISELTACSLGLIINESNNSERRNIFLTNNEYITPSRFCRRSSTKSWDAGAGSSEAICFSVNKPGVFISGIRVYSSTSNQFKYQAQLLDQALNEGSRPEAICQFKWRTLASVTGVHSDNENNLSKMNDICEIRFEKPILIQSNVKYALLFKNFSSCSYNGDMGLPQIRGDDDTIFTFMDCSLSKNGTNLNRGQIPQILYYHILVNDQPKSNSEPSFDLSFSQESIISMFEVAVDRVKDIFSLLIDAIQTIFSNNINDSSTSPSDSRYENSSFTKAHGSPNSLRILELLFQILDSVFFRQFISHFIMHLNILNFNSKNSYQLISKLREIVPLLASLNKILNDNFIFYDCSQLETTSSHMLLVESEHPYKPASVTAYLVKFPSSVKWMTVEFDSNSLTAQSEDYLEILIPSENYNNFVHIVDSSEPNYLKPYSDMKTKSQPFQNLVPVFRRFSGRNFDFRFSETGSQIHNNFSIDLNSEKIANSNCIIVPGSELVFMLQTSSEYVHSVDLSDNDAYYGFKAKVIGYEIPSAKSSCSKELNNNNSSSSAFNMQLFFHFVKQKIQNFESELIYLLCLNMKSLLNASSVSLLRELKIELSAEKPKTIIDSNYSAKHRKLVSLLNKVDLSFDKNFLGQIFEENFSLLSKSLNVDNFMVENVNDFYLEESKKINSFLEDFIKLAPQTSGARLAMWLQNEALVLPDSCVINIIESMDSFCYRCVQLLESNFFHTQKLCCQCHYQFFVKTLSQSFDVKNVFIGNKIFIKIVTRDQHQEIVYDSNACIEIDISFNSTLVFNGRLSGKLNETSDHVAQNDFENDGKDDNKIENVQSQLLKIVSENPYQMTLKDKNRYHSITMMKAYECYSLEELRYYIQPKLFKNNIPDNFETNSNFCSFEKINVRSFSNGYYLASWTPNSTGCYKIELSIDGEQSSNTWLVNVVANQVSLIDDHPSSVVHLESSSNLFFDNNNYSKTDSKNFPSLNKKEKSISNYTVAKTDSKPKHSIRKFICHDSAGLRIRSLPSLQSEQIGIVACFGLLTVVDQIENDDGIWVRLSNECIQAYCSNSSSEIYRQSIKSSFISADNFEYGAGAVTSDLLNLSSNIMKQSSTFILRSEAWSLQHNRHFNRTLLVSIDSEEDVIDNESLSIYHSTNKNIQKFLKSLYVPGWFSVVNCGDDGHLIRNWPILEEVSIIIGIVPINKVVYAVEVIQNKFGIWVRLSQDSLHSFVNSLYKSNLSESNVDGWMLVQNLSGLVYMKNTQQNHLASYLVPVLIDDEKDIPNYNDENISNNNPKKYNMNEKNQQYTPPAKLAISNRAAQCIRAIFAAFVWHEDILQDAFTAASYLKFNAEVTKELVKQCHANEDESSQNGFPLRKKFSNDLNSTKLSSSTLSNRNQKAAFRHSVEVSQLLMNLWSSDVNSNSINNAAGFVSFLENNNNSYDNNQKNDSKKQDAQKENTLQIPEILINLLLLWDHVSNECLKIFTYFNQMILFPNTARSADDMYWNDNMQVESISNNNESNINKIKEQCFQCEYKQTFLIEQQFTEVLEKLFSQIILDRCDYCSSDKNKKLGELSNTVGSSLSDQKWRKQVKIENTKQLYTVFGDSAYFLLSLIVSNTQANMENASFLNDKSSSDESKENDDSSFLNFQKKKLSFFGGLLNEFLVEDNAYFQSFQHLGIEKSFYEKKVAEEQLFDLAVLSLQREDCEHLISPEELFYDKHRFQSTEFDGKIKELSEDSSSFKQKIEKKNKFCRSISVGMNNNNNSLKNDSKSLLFGGHQQTSKFYETITNKNNEEGSEFRKKSFVASFLSKPSSRLIDLVQTYIENKVHCEENKDFQKLLLQQTSSTLMKADVFKFIFSCYNVGLYRLKVKSALVAAAYRAAALNALNWLLINVSSPVSLHDIMYAFVYSLLYEDKAKDTSVNNMNIDGNKKNSEEKKKVEKNLFVDNLCQHPFKNLELAGRLAENWIGQGFHRFLKSVADLLPLLPNGSALQRMAVQCFGIEFNSHDHIFLHECKLFTHISKILTRSSLEDSVLMLQGEKNELLTSMNDGSFLHSDIQKRNKDCSLTQLTISKDSTSFFDLITSSRQAMVSSLLDNSTETFWESGNEDRNKAKHIIISCKYFDTLRDSVASFEKESQIKFVLLHIDNVRDIEYRVGQISFKIGSRKSDQKYQNAVLADSETDMIKRIDLDTKFCGWIQCELNLLQSNDMISAKKFLKIELNGPCNFLRVRQVKLLSILKFHSDLDDLLNKNKRTSTASCFLSNSNQIQRSDCEKETLRVFRLLTSQVFGKLLFQDVADQNLNEKRLSSHQNNSNVNENDLREHMVGILFSQSGNLNELQKQVFSHIVREIHVESVRVREEWEFFINDSNRVLIQQSSDTFNDQLFLSSIQCNDSYCFELLSLILALSGSSIGCKYLSKQQIFFYDILSLLHTCSDRVKRQVLSLIRRVILCIRPSVFAQLFNLQQIPDLNDIIIRTINNHHNSLMNQDDASCDNVLSHVGLIDIFLSCVAKSLNVQMKLKNCNNKSRSQTVVQSLSKMINKDHFDKQWWLKGFVSKQTSQSIILLIKDFISGHFGKDWSEVVRNSVIEKILNLTRLKKTNRMPEECLRTPTLWLALASLCVLDEKDAEMLSLKNLESFHDQANGNSLEKKASFCVNHDDGETIAFIHCDVCGNLCADCDRFLHLNTKTRSHKRHILKDEEESIKVDIHEGCSRVKFSWVLVVADSKLLKAIIEFRNSVGNEDGKDKDTENSGDQAQNLITGLKENVVCRFCGSKDLSSSTDKACSNEDCQRFEKQVCLKTLACNHLCYGILNELNCLPCLHGCSYDLRQDGDDMCMICFSESLFSAPCIQLMCKHVFHFHCVQTVLEKRWSGGKITFTFSLCPICKVSIDHPSLVNLLEPIKLLQEDIKRKALMRLEYEGYLKCDAITSPQSRFYNDPVRFAIERYSYYLCFKCKKAYYGGEARCEADFDSINFNPEELICGSCSDVTQAQICPKHGTDYLEYKCRFCCSVAVYFCFGSTHFCNACHDDFQRLVSLEEYAQCPVGARGVPLEGSECPLRVKHPPTGEEFALGCGICRNSHTF